MAKKTMTVAQASKSLNKHAYKNVKNRSVAEASKSLSEKKSIFLPKGERSSFAGSSSILGLLLIILICFALFRLIMGYEPIYFSSFLDIITNAPIVDFSFSIPTTWLGDWGFLNFVRDFVSIGLQVINFLIYIVNGLVNALVFIFFLLQNLIGTV